ncbi:ribulose-phosphate 3-epimerase [Rhodocytophaga rosea]|uniref:Ribulose-phosphate 3-epimerase n=1 Tax=Rhodocytophaga rosea TaxID=2704465 RepID=A0A6C0GUD7_9BACT|nr:ribulose-phosphate 3-epimerase [Rhodocytophaga rosea]QHT70962.1 ribulose-phosphate 3-epimerase [Rhodocytophaga rosea]
MKPILAPSILAADFTNLGRDIELINQSQADWIHFDVMDGHFVPNISFGLPVCEAVHRIARKPLDVHLMITEPDRYLEAFAKAGAAHITVHLEACTHLHRTIHHIQELGCKAGVALNPHTPVQLLEDIIADLDIVLVMTVNPGFGGQKFIEHSYQKIAALKELIAQHRSHALIEVDGGVNEQNTPALIQAGAQVLVAGNFVFSSPNPTLTIENLKNTVVSYKV